MSVQAEITRSKRQRWAQPGGFHDRLVRTLAVALPAAVGVLFAFMVLAPLSPRGEISFLLDRNKVATVQTRTQLESAMYRGLDNKGRPFSITAASGVQRSSAVPVVTMRQLVARILLDDGPAALTANSGAYDMRADQVQVFGPVVFTAADGYRMTANDVDIDVNRKHLASRGPVDGRAPAGPFRADRIVADLEARTVTLEGHARLRMQPGKMEMPKP